VFHGESVGRAPDGEQWDRGDRGEAVRGIAIEECLQKAGVAGLVGRTRDDDDIGSGHAREQIIDLGGGEDVSHRIGPVTSGLLRGIEDGWFTSLIADSAFTYQTALEKGDKQVVGVNTHTSTVSGELEILRVSHEVELEQRAVLAARRAARDDVVVRRTLADLRGRSIDAAAQGNPIDLLIRYALREAKLTPDDVTLSYKVRSPSDVPYLFRERQVELAGVSEPTATFIARRGLATKWIGYSDVVPWYQDIFLAASDDFVRRRPDEVKALVRACLRATNAFDASRGAWSPAGLATAAKWTKLDKEDLKATGHLPYWSLTGKVDADALARVQDFWAERRLVRDPADIRVLAGQQAV